MINFHLKPKKRSKINQYKFEQAKVEHIPGIIDVFSKAFCHSEPMTRHLSINIKNFKIFAKTVAENAIKDGLSVVALNGSQVIACALIEDFAAMHEVPLDFDSNFKYIAKVLESLGADFFQHKQFEKGHVAHLFITAVDENYRHQGLSTKVNLCAIELAALSGFKFIYSELTNYLNEIGIFHHIASNKRLTGHCKYSEFEIEGFKPFEGLEGGANGYLWEIYPQTDLVYTTEGKKIKIRL